MKIIANLTFFAFTVAAVVVTVLTIACPRFDDALNAIARKATGDERIF